LRKGLNKFKEKKENKNFEQIPIIGIFDLKLK
jgi:hypothetical protein